MSISFAILRYLRRFVAESRRDEDKGELSFIVPEVRIIDTS
jgi:hypothetical protein